MAEAPVSSLVQGGLYTEVVGKRILHFERLTSTMDEAAALAVNGAEDGTVILAEEQTSGRGRFGRLWVSQRGNLLLSILLRPGGNTVHYLSMMAGLAVVQAIQKSTGLEATLKWPNDVLLRGRKVSGILVEQAFQGNILQYAVVGIGINCSFDPSTVKEVSQTATSLDIEANKSVDRVELLRYLLQELDMLYLQLGQPGPQQSSPDQETESGAGPEHIRISWRSCLGTLGQHVEVSWQGDVYKGYAEDVDGLGNLMLRLDDGKVVHLSAGEVTSAGIGRTGES